MNRLLILSSVLAVFCVLLTRAIILLALFSHALAQKKLRSAVQELIGMAEIMPYTLHNSRNGDDNHLIKFSGVGRKYRVQRPTKVVSPPPRGGYGWGHPSRSARGYGGAL